MRRVLMTALAAGAAMAVASPAVAGVTFSGSTTGCFGSGCVLGPTATDNGLSFTTGSFTQTTNGAGFAGIGGTTNNFGTIMLVPDGHDYTGDVFDLLITFTLPPGTGSGSFTADLLGSLTSNGVGGVNFAFQNGGTQYISDGMGGTYKLHVNDLAFSGTLPIGQLSFTQDINGYIIAGVPEPATWALMLLGFGGIGFAMRRQRSKVVLEQLA